MTFQYQYLSVCKDISSSCVKCTNTKACMCLVKKRTSWNARQCWVSYDMIGLQSVHWSVASITLSLALAIPIWSISLPQHRSKCLWESFSCMVRHVWGIWRTSYCTSRVLLHWTNIARIANAVQVPICLLVSTSVYQCLLMSTNLNLNRCHCSVTVVSL